MKGAKITILDDHGTELLEYQGKLYKSVGFFGSVDDSMVLRRGLDERKIPYIVDVKKTHPDLPGFLVVYVTEEHSYVGSRLGRKAYLEIANREKPAMSLMGRFRKFLSFRHQND